MSEAIFNRIRNLERKVDRLRLDLALTISERDEWKDLYLGNVQEGFFAGTDREMIRIEARQELEKALVQLPKALHGTVLGGCGARGC